uniref:Uncharacterized protein n=1 Tax=viral metagenome TaxID=1070528 RepID=A0A6C0E3D8_9ZZZZ
MTFYSEALASSSTIARFKTRQPQTVTSSATATASSEISQDDAYQKAYELALKIAISQAQHDANIIVQSVDTATIGEKIFYLGSSLLQDYIREEDDNKTYTLIKDFTLPDGMDLHIQKDKKLYILENIRLTINRNNEVHIYGSLYCSGDILVDGGKLSNHSSNSLTVNGDGTSNSNGLTVNNGTLENSNSGTMLVTSNGVVTLINSIFNNDDECICIIENGSIIYTPNIDNPTNTSVVNNMGTINISDVIDDSNTSGETGLQASVLNINVNSTLNNSGIINVGLGKGNSSSNSCSEIGFESEKNSNTGTINIYYNSSNQIIPGGMTYATNSIYLNIAYNPNSGNGQINNYVSSTIANGSSESSSVLTVSDKGATDVPTTATNFPTFITVIYQ